MLEGIVNRIRSFYSQKIDPIKEEVRPYLKEEDFSKLERTIHTAAASAGAASVAMAQGAAFGLDTPVLITIHIGMIISLGEIFGRSITKNTATALLGAAAGVGVGVFGVKAILGFVPIGGNLVNGAISFGYTELLGWTFVKYFKGDKDTIKQLEVHLKGEKSMGNTYNITGQVQVGSVGENASSSSNTFVQTNQAQTLSEAASEIQKLLKELEETNPTVTDTEKIAYVNDETTASFKRRVVGALQSGGEAAIEEFLDSPYVNIGKAIVKGWVKPE